jgi:hypothetical protein
MKRLLFVFAAVPLTLLAAQEARRWAGDDAIRRVENCTCFAAIDGQNLKPWQYAWDDQDKLRKQVSHCVCTAHIDVANVENPRRYLVPGTTIK